MISISQGIDRYKVPVVGKNGKLNETIEVSALWSIYGLRYLGNKLSPLLLYALTLDMLCFELMCTA